MSDSSECTAKEHWVESFVRVRQGKPEIVSGHCRENRSGYERWKDSFRVSRPRAWPYKEEAASKWLGEEKEAVLEALGEIPQVLWPKENIRFFRLKKSRFPGNPASSFSDDTVLYDASFARGGDDKKFSTLARVIAHEFAHHLYRNLSIRDRRDYLFSAAWISGTGTSGDLGDVPVARREKGYVSEDGKLGPEEDFSNNIEYYLYDRELLKRETPAVHKWIYQRFGDNFSIGNK